MPQTDRDAAPRLYRTLFLSDLHLGAMGARPDLLLQFLQSHRAETYILAGDILDLWHPVVPQWGAPHQAVLEHFRQLQHDGARLIYIRGNHDPEPARAPEPRRLPVEARQEIVHETADGRRYLVVHGDAQDRRLLQWHPLTRLGSRIDFHLRKLDRRLRDSLPPPARRSPIEHLLHRANQVLYLRRAHEKRLVQLARARGVDGVICGHFHMAALHDRHGLIYANCGDWVDSFSALGEDLNGALRRLGGRRAVQPVATGGFAFGPAEGAAGA